VLISIFTVVLLTTAFIPNISMANEIGDLFNNNNNVGGVSNLRATAANIISIITTIGMVVAAIVMLVLGIKYMVGSASEKAEYKKTMMAYLIGAALVFGASAITTVVVNLSKGISSTPTVGF